MAGRVNVVLLRALAGHAHLDPDLDAPEAGTASAVPSPQKAPPATAAAATGKRARGRPRKHLPPSVPRPNVAKDVAAREDELRQMARKFLAAAGAPRAA